MKLVKLIVNNFMSIGSIDIGLDRVGMNLVLGKNLDDTRFDSNGSAKSALFEAMTWGLFGEFLRDLSAESVIRIGTDKVTVAVLVDPEDGSERVWFTRTRTKKEHAVDVKTESGIQMFPANSVKDIQPQINSWLGLDFRTFTNSVYFGKGLVKFFMASNDNERKDLLETILQLVSFDDALERAKSMAKKCSEDISAYNTDIAIAKALNNEKNTVLSLLIGNLTSAKKKYETNVPLLLDKKTRLVKEKESIVSSLSRLDILIGKEKKEYDEAYNKLSSDHVSGSEALDITLRDAVSYVSTSLDKAIATTKAEAANMEQQIQEGYEALKGIQNYIVENKGTISNEISKTKGTIHGIELERSHIRGLTENLPCKECHQNISIEHKDALIDKYNKEITPLNNHISSLEEQLVVLDKELIIRYTNPQQALKEKHVKVTSLYTSLVDTKQNEKRAALDELQRKNTQNKAKLSSEFIEATKKLQEDHHTKTNGWVRDKAERQIDITKIDTVLDSIVREIKELEDTHNQLYKQAEETKTEIDKTLKKQKYASDKIEEVETIKRKTEFWIEGFGPRGIKSFVFESALPYLTSRTNHYSSFLTGGTVTIDITPLSVVKSTGNVKEKLNVSAVNSKGANVYNGNSDGERRRIDICVLLALQDLISTRASKTWNTLIFDEIFDALDKTGIEHVVDMFRTFKGKSVYIISHSEDIKKHFDTAVIIQKKDGVSTVKEIV